jgi:hypothetical protein
MFFSSSARLKTVTSPEQHDPRTGRNAASDADRAANGEPSSRPSVEEVARVIKAVNPSGKETRADAQPPRFTELLRTILPGVARH